jgi:antitoxin HicB
LANALDARLGVTIEATEDVLCEYRAEEEAQKLLASPSLVGDSGRRAGARAATMEGSDGTKNPHIGSTFESWLDEKGIREEATAAAIKSVIAEQIAAAMKEQGLSKTRMAELMHTSRAQFDRLLDPANNSATLETLMRAAKVIGRELRLELV